MEAMATFHGVNVGHAITILLALFLRADAKWVEDTIDTGADWVFITRFCFLSQTGTMKYHLEYPVGYQTEKFLFYYDVPGQWDSVYKKGLSCQQKIDALQGRNQFDLTEAGNMCVKETRNSVEWYVCEDTITFNAARERWWFMAVSRCGSPANSSYNGMYLYYKLHMTNGDDLLHKEYSADEFYILVVDIVFLILYVKIMILSIVCAVILKKRQLLHTTYKMYMVAVTIWTIHLFCMCCAWGSYGTTGWEVRQLEVFGRILQAVSTIIFILMLILLAKGYTIVRGRLTTKAVVKITIFINLYIIATVVLFIWEAVLFDPGLVLYYYESPPGYGMITIILIGWLWFTKAAVFTLKHYKSKTCFYITFYTIYTFWFWASPIVTLIAMFSMAKWTREKTVNGVQQFIAYLGHLFFLLLTMPSKVNDNFPYHIRTTQIGAMSDDSPGDSARSYTINDGSDTFTGIGPNLELFITAKGNGADVDTDGHRMYRPLNPNSLRDETDDSPPPSYPQAVGSRGTLPPIGGTTGNNNYTSTFNSNNNNIDPLGQRNNHLPPLTQALHGDTNGEGETVLPPLRGTGLPPIVPSAPASTQEQDYETAPTKSHTDMFRVDK